jgi:hypothetical protein
MTAPACGLVLEGVVNMRAAGRIIGIVGWALTLVLQAGAGLIVGFRLVIAFRPPWTGTVLLFGIGAVLGSIGVGSVSILLRRSIVQKRYLARAVAATIAALVPTVALIAVGVRLGSGSAAVEDRWGPLLSVVVIPFSALGFHVPAVVRGRPPSQPAQGLERAA